MALPDIFHAGYSWMGNDGVRRYPVREVMREGLSLEMDLSRAEIETCQGAGQILISRLEWEWVPGKLGKIPQRR